MHERPAFAPIVAVASLALSTLAGAAVHPSDRPEAAPREGATRIVSLSLAADEVLLPIVEDGARIVAIDEFADDPASNVRTEAERIPRRVRASVEEVLSLSPDVVFVSAWASAELRAAIERAGVRLVTLPAPTSLAEVSANVRWVGREVGAPEAAEALVLEMWTRIAAVRMRVAGSVRPRVLFRSESGISPGEGTLAAEVVDAAGGTLVSTGAGFAPLPAERALGLDVDVVVVDDYVADGRSRSIAGDPAMDALRRRARVLSLPPNVTMTTSHHVAGFVEALADVLHPEGESGPEPE